MIRTHLAFWDTNRAQWETAAQQTAAWNAVEAVGAAHHPASRERANWFGLFWLRFDVEGHGAEASGCGLRNARVDFIQAGGVFKSGYRLS